MSDSEALVDEARARERLRTERERIEHSLADLSRLRPGELGSIETEQDPVDQGEQLQEEGIDDAVVEQLRADLEAIERAEKRLEDGTYGISVESGEPIPPERLEAIPWAERTPEEQQRYEGIHARPR
jgi:DnaK suppressor protein